MVAVAIFTLIMAGLFAVLNAFNVANVVSVSKLPLQQEARNVLGWIVKDVRQTSQSQIANNNPTANHIKFKTCLGHDGTSALWSAAAIEYTYDPDTKIITRTDYGTGRTWQFSNISVSPFGVSSLVNNILTVTISVQKQLIGAINPILTITTEVKLRNG